MSDRVIPKTFGEEFILGIDTAETKGILFSVLEEAAEKHYPQHDLSKYLHKLSDFNSVATYQDKLARIRIAYNANAVKDIQDKLTGLKGFGDDGYNHKDKMIRKLNLLINNNPTLDDVIYIAISGYINKGYGSCEKFKSEFKNRIKDKNK